MTDQAAIGDIRASRLHVVCGASFRLREHLLSGLLAGWDGPITKHAGVPDAEALILGLDTPSLFEPAACHVARVDDAWPGKHVKLLAPLIGSPVSAGVLVLVTVSPPRGNLLKQLDLADALQRVELPGRRELSAWLTGVLLEQPQGVEEPRRVAEALMAHRGDDLDAILAAIDQVAIYCGDEPISAHAVDALLGGEADKPTWQFVDAFLAGRGARAMAIARTGAGLDAHRALASVLGEIRLELAALATDDGAEAARLAGTRGGPRVAHARRRARELGRACLLRLLTGVLQAQRDLRRTGSDPDLLLEMLVVNAQRVIRSG